MSESIEPSAKAIIIRDNRILLIRYEDTSFGLGTWYSLPGGRQKFGENLRDAVVRECLEEIGAEVRAGELLYIREYIHANHKLAGVGRDQHKIEFMFLCELLGEPESTGDDDDQAAVEWVALSSLPDVNVYPSRLSSMGGNLLAAFERAGDNPQDSAVEYWGDSY